MIDKCAMALFSSPQKPKTFQNYPSYRILRRMYGALNIDKNLYLIFHACVARFDTTKNVASFSSSKKPKTFQDFSSHRILRHTHGTLNIDEK